MTTNQESIFKEWAASFKDNFRFDFGIWIKATLLNLWAVFYVFVFKLPVHLKRLFVHLVEGISGVGRWLFVDGVGMLRKSQGDGSAGGEPKNAGDWVKRGLIRLLAWVGRLFSKTLDLFAIPEIVNFIMNFFKINSRPLTADEISELKMVFGDSLLYWRIRCDEWSFLAQLGNWVAEKRTGVDYAHMAMTIFSTIHFSRRIVPKPGNPDMEWLIHELTHAAQMEHVGSQFIVEAVIAQGQEGYNYGGPQNLFNKNLADFNREQQGDIVKHYYSALNGHRRYAPHIKEYERMIAQLRAGKL